MSAHRLGRIFTIKSTEVHVVPDVTQLAAGACDPRDVGEGEREVGGRLKVIEEQHCRLSATVIHRLVEVLPFGHLSGEEGNLGSG